MEHDMLRRFGCALCALAFALTALPTAAFAQRPEEQAAVQQSLSATDVREMQQADAAVTALTGGSDYAQMTEDERTDAALQQLDALTAQGLVKQGSVYTDAENGMISFTYSCGALGGILLTDPEEENTAALPELDESQLQELAENKRVGTAAIYYAFDNTINSTRYPYYAYIKDAISLLIFSVVGALTVQLTFLLTIEKSNAATATVLQFLSPTIIVAWFSLVRKSRPGILVFCAILTSLVGTFLLVTHGNPTSLSISPAALFWGIASAFAAAFYTTYPSTLIARYGTLSVVGWSMLIGGLILLPFYARQGTNFVVNGSLILAFFYLIVIGTSLTFSLYLKGAQLIGGPKASILSCAEPLSSALLSLLLLGITFTLPDWLGTLLILSSVILISMDSRRRARKINRPARDE